MEQITQTIQFHICTLVTNWMQYDEMQRSFVAAGFDETNCRFTACDNSQSNVYEPYSLINKLLKETKEPYIILCHQDILLDRGCGCEHLMQIIRTLDSCDPHWAVLGNAGCTDDYDFIIRVSDPTQWEDKDRLELSSGREPQAVHSLDENFLVFKTQSPLCASTQLSGFHLYGTDVCLHARLQGYSCYVIDFNLTHLSPGNFGAEFRMARDQFVKHWNRKFHFVYIIRGAEIFLSKWQWLHRLGPRHRVRSLFLKNLYLRRWMTKELRPAVKWR